MASRLAPPCGRLLWQQHVLLLLVLLLAVVAAPYCHCSGVRGTESQVEEVGQEQALAEVSLAVPHGPGSSADPPVRQGLRPFIDGANPRDHTARFHPLHVAPGARPRTAHPTMQRLGSPTQPMTQQASTQRPWGQQPRNVELTVRRPITMRQGAMQSCRGGPCTARPLTSGNVTVLRRRRGLPLGPKPRSSSYRDAVLLAIAVAAVLGATVVLSEKRVSAAQTESARVQEAADAAADAKTSIDEAINLENTSLEAVSSELVTIQGQVNIARETLEAMVQQQADGRARAALAAAGEQAASDPEVKAAVERLQVALRERNSLLLETDTATRLKGLTKETAESFIERTRRERQSLEAEIQQVDEALQVLEAQRSVKETILAKKAKLKELNVALETSKKEVETMENQLHSSQEQALSAEGGVNERLEALEATKAQLLESRDMQIKKSEGLSSARQELMLGAANTLDAVLRHKALLAALQKFPTPGTCQDIDSDTIGALSNTEKELVILKEKLQLLKSERDVLVAEIDVASETEERAALQKALDQLDHAFRSRVAMPETAEAKERVAAARLALDAKKDLNSDMKARLTKLEKEIHAAEESVLKHEQIIQIYRDAMASKIGFPVATAKIKYSELMQMIHARDDRLLYMLDEAHNFSANALKFKPEGMDSAAFWKEVVDPRAKAYIKTLEALLSDISAILTAERIASDELKRREYIEDLQSLSLEELAAEEAAGPEASERRELASTMWQDIQIELSEQLSLFQRAKERLQRAEKVLNDIQDADFDPDNPGRSVAALTHIVKEQMEVKLHSERILELSKITEKDVKERVKECFTEALWQAKRRREQYGVDENVLEAIHRSHTETLEEALDQLAKIRNGIAPKGSEYTQLFSLRRTPKIEIQAKSAVTHPVGSRQQVTAPLPKKVEKAGLEVPATSAAEQVGPVVEPVPEEAEVADSEEAVTPPAEQREQATAPVPTEDEAVDGATPVASPAEKATQLSPPSPPPSPKEEETAAEGTQPETQGKGDKGVVPRTRAHTRAADLLREESERKIEPPEPPLDDTKDEGDTEEEGSEEEEEALTWAGEEVEELPIPDEEVDVGEYVGQLFRNVLQLRKPNRRKERDP